MPDELNHTNARLLALISTGSVIKLNSVDKIPANYQLLLTFNDDSFLVFTVVMYGFNNVYPDSYIDNKYYKLSRESISPLSDKYTEAEFEKLVAEEKKC